MPGLQSANISAKLLRELAGNAVIGPMLLGMEKPVQIVPMTALAPDVLTLAGLAVGFWSGQDELRSLWQVGRRFEPDMTQPEREARMHTWKRAVERSRDWAAHD